MLTACAGVNGVVTERYMELLKESKVRGYLFEQQNYIPKS